MKKILVICDYYLPGYKSGGGMRTIVNMIERLGSNFDFEVITRDHDGPFDEKRYPDIEINEWNEFGNAKVYFPEKKKFSLSTFRELINQLNPDALYLNSFFSTPTIFVLLLRKFKQIDKIPIIIAPCGELSEGALSLKSQKKKIFQYFSGILGLYDNLVWKASSEMELKEISLTVGKNKRFFVAPDMPPKYILPDYDQSKKPEKVVGKLKIVFMSRIYRKKNLSYFIEILQKLNDTEAEIIFDIFGPIEDESYWNECQNQIKNLPANVQVNYLETLPNHMMIKKLVEYHLFVLPTLGENFGHVFIEAFAAGCPVLISDQTPWLDLEQKGIGFDLSLQKTTDWCEKVKYFVSLDNESFVKTSGNARRYVLKWLEQSDIQDATNAVLQSVTSSSS